jgi:prepilin-type processing-associated H-X9-DG protein
MKTATDNMSFPRKACPRPDRGRESRLFCGSWLECAAVVAIVVFALAIIFPAASTARSGGKSTLCLANLHILGRAWLTYQEDNDGKLVNGHVPRDSNYANSAYWLKTFKDNAWWVNPPHNASGVYTGDPIPCTLADEDNGIRSGKLFPYVGTSAAYHCSSDLSYLKTINRGGKRSYSITGLMHGEHYSSSIDYADRYAQIIHPSVKLVYLENNDARGWCMGSWIMMATLPQWVDPLVMNHDGRTTLGFADGHAEFHAWGTLDSMTGMPTSPNALYYMASIYLPKR